MGDKKGLKVFPITYHLLLITYHPSLITYHLSRILQDFARGDVIPGFDCRQRTVIRHVAFERSDGNEALLYGLIIRAIGGGRSKILLADPVVRFAARVSVLADDGARVLQALPGDAHAFNLTTRNIDVEQRSFRQAFFQDFADGCDGEACGFREIESLACDQTEGYSRHA